MNVSGRLGCCLRSVAKGGRVVILTVRQENEMYLRETILASVLIAAINTAMPLSADEPSNPTTNYATVKLFFINQWMPEPARDDERQVTTSGGMGGMGAMQMRFETASIYLNDKFVGHTIFRHVDFSPKFNLPAGDYKFRIECDGYEKIEKSLTVLENGSQQWLVVKLERQNPAVPVGSATPSEN
jgi:hypothetical protein